MKLAPMEPGARLNMEPWSRTSCIIVSLHNSLNPLPLRPLKTFTNVPFTKHPNGNKVPTFRSPNSNYFYYAISLTPAFFKKRRTMGLVTFFSFLYFGKPDFHRLISVVFLGLDLNYTTGPSLDHRDRNRPSSSINIWVIPSFLPVSLSQLYLHIHPGSKLELH